MGVPAHDERDFAFAKKYNLPIKPVISKDGKTIPSIDTPTDDDGILINSGEFSNLTSEEARKILTEFAEKNGFGKGTVRYRFRDWLISRQRYWGAPIPIIHCPVHGAVLVNEEDLPVLLPDEVDFSPRDTGESPLANDPDFVNTTCPICGRPSKRETDTQDGFACSSWYFLRFADPKNTEEPFDKEKVKYWLPVDLYIGGPEHAVMHLLYARFYTKVIHDAGLIDFDEPFKKLLNQGMILGSDHQKMSKSRGNVVNPDAVIKEYGTDTLRAYILFIGPLDTDAPWSTEGINGVNRFIRRMWNQFVQLEGKMPSKGKEIEKEIEITTDKWVQKITDQAEKLKFNTMISSFMEWLNYLTKITQDDPEVMDTKAYRDAVDTFITMIAPATPFVAEELYHRLGGTGSIHTKSWPKPKGLYKEEKATIIVQVNGKLRDKVEVALGSELEEVLDLIKNRIK